eukprot:6129678-Amphidinium_carterae.1
MLLQLHGLAAKLRGWAEGCSCHEDLRQGRQRYDHTFQYRLQQCYADSHITTCPLAGMRAPEIATGALEGTMVLLAEQGTAAILSKVAAGGRLKPPELSTLLNDYDIGRKHFLT